MPMPPTKTKTFLATIEVRIVMEVPENFGTDQLNNSLEVYKSSRGVQVACKGLIEDIETIDVSSEEHTDADAKS